MVKIKQNVKRKKLTIKKDVLNKKSLQIVNCERLKNSNI